MKKSKKKKFFKNKIIKKKSKKIKKNKKSKSKIKNKQKQKKIINIGGSDHTRIKGNITLDLKPLKKDYDKLMTTVMTTKSKLSEFLKTSPKEEYTKYTEFLKTFDEDFSVRIAEAAAKREAKAAKREAAAAAKREAAAAAKRRSNKKESKKNTEWTKDLLHKIKNRNVLFNVLGLYPINLLNYIRNDPELPIKNKGNKTTTTIIEDKIKECFQLTGGTRKHEYKKITEYRAKGGANNLPNLYQDEEKVVYIQNETAHIFVINDNRGLFNYLFENIRGREDIKNLIFYGELTGIPQTALCYFYNITSISFETCPFTGKSPNIETIGQGALQGSSDLTYYNYSPVWIFGSLTSRTINIGGYSCSFLKLTELDFSYCSESIIIGAGAFYFCENLSKIIFPQDAYLAPDNTGTITIGAGAFQNCFLLKEIYIFIIPPWAYADDAIIREWITHHIDNIFGDSLMHNHVSKGSTINGLRIDDYINGFCNVVTDVHRE